MTNNTMINDLEKQGKKLAGIAKFLLIAGLILALVLCDMSFVPQGEKWELMKARHLEFAEYDAVPTDKEIWADIKEACVNSDIAPFASGYLCWLIINLDWDSVYGSEIKINPEENSEVTSEEQKHKSADDYAQVLRETVNEFLDDNPYIGDRIVDLMVYDGYAIAELYEDENYAASYCDDALDSMLTGQYADVQMASGTAIIRDGRCVSAAFAPDVLTRLYIGIDTPELNGDGTFNYYSDWESRYVVGLAG